LLPIEVSDAGWLSDMFKSSSKQSKSPKHVASPKPATPAKPAASPKRHTVRLAALGPAALHIPASKPVTTICDPSKFRIVLDVGHTAASEGATSARNVAEFVFNLRLAQQIDEKLKAEGFAGTKLLVTEGKARPSLVKRLAAAKPRQAGRRRERSASQSLPVDPPRFRAQQIPREMGIRGQEELFQRPLQRLFRLRLQEQSGLQNE